MFNWVHNKFQYNPLKAESTRNVLRKNTESVPKEVDKQALTKQVDEIVDILDDWKINGRRLTICVVEKSFKPRNFRTEYCSLKKEEKRDEVVDKVDDDELSPLMATTFQNNFDDSGEFCTAFEKSQVIMAIERHVTQEICRSDGEKIRKSKGPRVTLADLFMADADVKPKPASEKVTAQDLQKKPVVQTVNGSCFAKKPKEAAQAAKNLRRLMGKMMKRKIHAEVEDEQLLGERRLTNN